MKRFIRSVGGKTTLFIAFFLCAMIAIAGMLGIYVIWEENLYSTSESEVLHDTISNSLRENAWSYYLGYEHDTEQIILPDGCEASIKNVAGETVKHSLEYTFAENDSSYEKYTYVFGKYKDEDGVFSYENYYSDVYEWPAPYAESDSIEYSLVTLYVSKTATISEQTAMAQKLMSRLYAMRYSIYLLEFFMLLACIVIFVMLMCAAGHVPQDNEIHPGPLHKVPFDVLAIAAVGLCICVVAILFEIYIFPEEVAAGIGALVSGVVGLGLCMCFASRVKQGKLLKGTLCYKVLKLIARFFRWVWFVIMQVPLVWKTVLALAGISLIELLVIAGCSHSEVAFFWFVEKLVVVPLVIIIASTMQKLKKTGEIIASGNLAYKMDTRGFLWDFKKHAEDLNSISEGMSNAVEKQLKSERMKTELITNVSHDLKTPLTSIINYADLLQREESSNEKTKEYAEVLLRQSKKLKRLLEDLVEASKAATGNLEVVLAPCSATVLVAQTSGEYEEKLQEAGLTLVTNEPEENIQIMADGRRMWRVFDNLMNNICKYSQKGSRVYLSLEEKDNQAVITFKNISREPLNISADELMERFVRGDSSRNTEGNGLGLSIARSMTELQRGTFHIDVDGDLFKVTLKFPTIH